MKRLDKDDEEYEKNREEVQEKIDYINVKRIFNIL